MSVRPAAAPEADAYRASAPRRVARRAWRLLRGLVATIGLSSVWLLGRPFHRGPERSRAWSRKLMRSWGRAMTRTARVHVEVVGEPPREPCVLVMNHVGYADIVSLASVLDGPAFVSQHEIRSWPLVGAMAARMGTIFIDRSDKRSLPTVNAAIERALANGHVVVLFPEGRNSDGSLVRPFRPALLESAARLNAPCAWATMHYQVLPGDPPASRSVCWHQEPIVRQLPRFLALDRVEARVVFGSGRLRDTDRKRLAAQLHERVSSAFRPME
jgi:1-acyl-sn-glycerol-3-phosphate acyltransferase